MNWTQLLHHDHTPYFLSKPEAGLGDHVTVRLRVPTSAAIQKAFLVVLKHGEPHPQRPMRVVKNPSLENPVLQNSTFWTYFEAEMPLESPTVRYSFTVVTDSDTVHLTTRGARHFTAPYRDWFQFLPDWHAPAWLADRVFYQIFPDRFRNGDPSNDVQDGEYLYDGKPVMRRDWNTSPTKEGDVHEFFGGDLQGITQSLDYLQDLGVNGLWLTPIFESPSNHKYDTRDYLNVDSHFGGNAALRELLDQAHARGIKIVLDGVFNHTGDEYVGFTRALESGPERIMFNFNADGQYAAFYDVPTLPKVDHASELARTTFLDGPDSIVRHWMRFGADGWRLDVAHMLGANASDARNLEMHRRLRTAARSENPDAYIFGERNFDAERALQGPDEASGFEGGGEDGVMNYHGFAHPITEWLSGHPISNTVKTMPTQELSEIMQEAYRVLPTPRALSQYNLLGSHDTPRILWRLRGDANRLHAAFAVLMAFPGVPGVYYGDEIGLTQSGQPFVGNPPMLGATRVPFPWDETRWDSSLHGFVRTLIHARLESLALQRGGLVWLHDSNDEIAFARPFTDESGRTEVAICAVSRQSRAQQAAPLQLDVTPTGVLEGAWRDVVTGEVFHAQDGKLSVNVSSPRVLLPV